MEVDGDIGFDKAKVEAISQAVNQKETQLREAQRSVGRMALRHTSFASYGHPNRELAAEIEGLKSKKEEEENKAGDEKQLDEVSEAFSGDVAENPRQISETLVITRNDALPSFDSKVEEADARMHRLDEAGGVSRLINANLVNTTNHLDSIIRQRAFMTRSALKRTDPTYFERTQKASPLNPGDEDVLYFSYDKPERNAVGQEGIAFAGSEVLIDSGLIFEPNRSGFGEVAVSDVRVMGEDKMPSEEKDAMYGQSDLKLSLDRAVMFVPKRKYKERCIQLIRAGYSKEWIRDHLFSYRGVHTDKSVSDAIGAEITRRMDQFKKKVDVSKVQVLANPDGHPNDTHLFQMKTI